MAKTYLPQEYINSNYRYTISDDTIVVHTNNNCFQQYNSTYCDCYNIFPTLDYLHSYSYACNYNSNINISYQDFTSDVYHRIDLPSILIIFLVLFIFIIFIPYKIISRLFGRWLKV